MPPAPLPIVIETEPLSPAPQRWLSEQCELVSCSHEQRAELLKQLHSAQGLVVRTYTQVDRELLDHAPKLRVIARAGVGLDNIDLDACRSRSIAVVHTPNANTHAVVEYIGCVLLNPNILDRARSIMTLDDQYRTEDWHTLRERAISDRSVVDTTLGIIGLGRIGSRVAMLGNALGMRVLYSDICEIPEDQCFGAQRVPMDELLQRSAIITLNTDAREENHRLINANHFAQMKPDVLFINAARGQLVDPDALVRFAQSNPDARLVLDVYDPEPLDDRSLLRSLPNVILTPHIGSGTHQAKEAMSWVVRDLMRVLNNESAESRAV